MTVELVKEPGAEPPYERCCFCRAPTAYWVKDKDVACCKECAERAHPTDVPSKRDWCNRERIADHSIRTNGWRSNGRGVKR